MQHCSRCRDSGFQCTFVFISNKSTLKTARKRLGIIQKENDTLHGSQKQDPICATFASDSEVPTTNESSGGYSPASNACSASETNLFPTWNNSKSYNDPGSDQQLTPDILPSGMPTTSTIGNGPEIDELFDEIFPNAFQDGNPEDDNTIHILSAKRFETGSILLHSRGTDTEKTISHKSSATGFDPALEFAMLQDFHELVLRQFPVIDIDLVFLRYRFGMPTPLPKYLILTLIACGASMSCKKLVPGIDLDLAKTIFDLAREELIRASQTELCTDIISALSLVSFHWQGDLTQSMRETLLDLSVSKVQQLGLHKEFVLNHERSPREAGMLRYLVWLNYIADAFSPRHDQMPGQPKLTKPPYQGREIELEPVSSDDMAFLCEDFLTGKVKSDLAHVRQHIQFHTGFGQLAKLHNKALSLQYLGYSIQHLIPELQSWTDEYLAHFDMLTIQLDGKDANLPTPNINFAFNSLNFAYWYCALNIYFDKLKPKLNTNNSQMSYNVPLAQEDSLDELNVYGCYVGFTTLITLFERLAARPELFQTSQTLRGNLYYGGAILQIFYRNHVQYRGASIVDESLLRRWESCVTICDVVWGPSSREIDLDRLAMQEVS